MEGVVRFGREQDWAMRTVILSREGIPQNWQPDAVVLLHSYVNEELLQYLRAATMPIVFVGRRPPQDFDFIKAAR